MGNIIEVLEKVAKNRTVKFVRNIHNSRIRTLAANWHTLNQLGNRYESEGKLFEDTDPGNYRLFQETTIALPTNVLKDLLSLNPVIIEEK